MTRHRARHVTRSNSLKIRAEYDFSKAAKNPYARKLKAAKKQVTIRLDTTVLAYFRSLAVKAGIPGTYA